MKKLIVLLVIVFTANLAVAQKCNESHKKNSFELVDGLIKATLYHDNGEVAQTGYYTLENKLQGEWVSYNRFGVKTATARYNNGAKVGTWNFFDGDTMKEVTYVNSKVSKVKTWQVTDSRVVSN